MKFRLRLDNEIDVLTKPELDDSLAHNGKWEREAAFGLRHQTLPRMIGTPSAGTLALGADQPDQPTAGPGAGWYWSVHRVSIDGLVAGDAVKLYKLTNFLGWVTYQPGLITFGRGQCILKPGEYLRVVGTGLTTTAQVEVTGEGESTPGPLMWRLL
jgi:hypothetical protein